METEIVLHIISHSDRLDEILVVVQEMGFGFRDLDDQCGNLTFAERKFRSKEAEYGFNVKTLTQNAYKTQVWVAQKT
ncbi:hypothetical protein BDV95DRAFT_575293 [Massariosphaeria phaeospora]|uniref:Uncharacterized protein n=1 Tax=Massariosphaeria phaeospora TaxID=100035 RepID=A0A7C8I3V4_9PLEO|nr:hypothetical protein BDV95DRAFT_575293 [Massariosphaeria phaeospora]